MITTPFIWKPPKSERVLKFISLPSYVLFSLVAGGSVFAAKNSKFEELIKPLDLFKTPSDVKKLMTKKELYQQLSSRGVKIRIAKEDYSNALEKYWQSYAGYNLPRASLSSSYKLDQRAANQVVSNYGKSFSTSIGLSGDTGWGLSYNIGLPTFTRTLSDSPTFSTESDQVSMGLTSVNLALLRGSVFFIGRNAKNTADLDMGQSKHTLKSTILTSIQSAENAFFDVLLKQIRVQVLELSLRSSQALLSDVKEMVSAGESDRLSLLKTELQIAQNETDLLQARIELSNSRQALRDLISLRLDENLDFYPDPNELKSTPILPDLSVPNALNRAKTLRPDYLNALIGKKKAELSMQTAFSNTLPKLDLSFSYGYAGSGASFNQAKEDLLRFGPPTASVGLDFSYGFFNDSASFTYRQAKFSLHRAEVQVEEVFNQMTKEINSAVISVEMGNRRLKTAGMSRQLSEKKLQQEFEKFRVGESKIRDIIDFQNEVNNARITELNARVDFLKSLTSLRTSIGELPEGITLSFSHD